MKNVFETSAGLLNWRFLVILALAAGAIVLLSALTGCTLPEERTLAMSVVRPAHQPWQPGISRAEFSRQAEAWNKSEFETQAQYQRRMDAITNAVCVSAPLAYVFHRYDAEKQSLFVAGSFGPVSPKWTVMPPPIFTAPLGAPLAEKLCGPDGGWFAMHLAPTGEAEVGGLPVLRLLKMELYDAATRSCVATSLPPPRPRARSLWPCPPTGTTKISAASACGLIDTCCARSMPRPANAAFPGAPSCGNCSTRPRARSAARLPLDLPAKLPA